MSLKSWQDEFYKKAPSKRMTKRQAVEHSILKWTGLLPKNLRKHGLELDSDLARIQEGDSFYDEKMTIASESCALCEKYYDNTRMFSDPCSNCPLYKSLGGRCDKGKMPYSVWRKNGDPLPMIRALKKTLKELEK